MNPGFAALYGAFAVVALWLLGEVLLQHRAPLPWRMLALAGFGGVAAGVVLGSVPLIGGGALGFALGQAMVTRAVKRGTDGYWSLRREDGSVPGPLGRLPFLRDAGPAPRASDEPAEPVGEVGPVEEAPAGERAFAGAPTRGREEVPSYGAPEEPALYRPQPLEDGDDSGVYAAAGPAQQEQPGSGRPPSGYPQDGGARTPAYGFPQYAQAGYPADGAAGAGHPSADFAGTGYSPDGWTVQGYSQADPTGTAYGQAEYAPPMEYAGAEYTQGGSGSGGYPQDGSAPGGYAYGGYSPAGGYPGYGGAYGGPGDGYGQSGDGYGQSGEGYGQSGEGYGQAADPQSYAPYPQQYAYGGQPYDPAPDGYAYQQPYQDPYGGGPQEAYQYSGPPYPEPGPTQQ